MEATYNKTITIELTATDVDRLLSDLQINGRDAVRITAYQPSTNKLIEALKEFRGDYDRVGF